MGYYQLLEDVRAFRAVWIAGRMRGGKTSLAYKIALDLSRLYGYSVTGNIPSVFRTRDIRHSVVVLDEAAVLGLSALRLQMALGKLDVVLLYPSAAKPEKDMCKMTVRLVMRINRVFPLLFPGGFYRVEFPDLGRQASYVVYVDASDAWGVYTSTPMPLSDGGFAQCLEKEVKAIGIPWSIV